MVKVKGATPAEKKVVNVAKKAARKPVEAKAKPQPDMQSGMEGVEPGSVAAKKAAVEEQFAAADAVGNPALDPIAAGLGVRGY